MKQEQLYILLIFSAISFAGKAQIYDSQYKICSASLDTFVNADSLYFAATRKKDSCLLGVSAPHFHAITLDNKEIESSKLKGQVIVLNFWFTGCEPCIEEMPGFNKLVETYARRKVTFISFTYDKAETVKKFLTQHPFKFKIVTRNAKVQREDFKLASMYPYTIIINKEGKIAFMRFGGMGADAFSYFKNIIDKLL